MRCWDGLISAGHDNSASRGNSGELIQHAFMLASKRKCSFDQTSAWHCRFLFFCGLNFQCMRHIRSPGWGMCFHLDFCSEVSVALWLPSRKRWDKKTIFIGKISAELNWPQMCLFFLALYRKTRQSARQLHQGSTSTTCQSLCQCFRIASLRSWKWGKKNNIRVNCGK